MGLSLRVLELSLGFGVGHSMTTRQLLVITSVGARTPHRVQVFTYCCFSAFRIEWSKARAQSECWREEVLLLREEMRSTLAFLKLYAGVWSARGCPSSLVVLSRDPAVREGITAYTEHQSHVFASLHDRFHSIRNGLEKVGNPVSEPTPIVSEDALMELPGGDI